MDPSGSKAGSLENKDEERALSAELFYNELADTTVRLKGGTIMRFNKAAMVINAKSKILYQIFLGNLRDDDVTDIPDIDYDSFKSFLDCCMGFDSYTFDNALKIFPIAWKYQIDNSIGKCVNALQLTEVNPGMYKVLNMAAHYNCTALIDQSYDCIYANFISIYKILEHQEFLLILEPETLKMLLPQVEMDSYVLQVLIKWGKSYVKKHYSNSLSLRSFMEKCGLLQYFDLKYFETTGAIAEFCFSTPEFFSFHEVLTHLQNAENHLVHGKSEWVITNKKGSIMEEIVIPITVNMYSEDTIFNGALVEVKGERKNVVFHDIFDNDELLISCEVILTAQNRIHPEDNIFDSRIKFDFPRDNVSGMTCFYRFGRPNFKRDSFLNNMCHFRIIWTFHHDCRVLLRNRTDVFNDPNKMYFTNDVSINFIPSGQQQNFVRSPSPSDYDEW